MIRVPEAKLWHGLWRVDQNVGQVNAYWYHYNKKIKKEKKNLN